MRFEVIRVGNLVDFIESKLYTNSLNKPITKQRAISQYHNPRADKEDMALLLALDDTEQIIGYVGALPDYFAKYPKLKLAWNSGWWVDPKKGKHIAMPLFLQFLKLWGNHVLFADMTEHSKAVVMRLNQFDVIKPLQGCKYYIHPKLSRVLVRKYPFFKALKPLLTLIDGITNSAVNLAYKFRFSLLKKKKYTAKFTDTIDDEAGTFIAKNNQNELFQRGQTELNWILKHPWIIDSSPQNIELSKNYYFSAVSTDFQNKIVKLYSESNALISVLFFTINEGVIKLPYIYFDTKDIELVTRFIQEVLIKEKAHSFITFHTEINRELQQDKLPYWYKKTLFREFVAGKELAEYLEWKFEYQEGNSDVVFT